MPAELRTLAESFNHMLDRLDSAFARQRLFVSDASHELRSPLTAVRGQLEVLARNETPSAEEIRHVERMAMVEIGRAERLVDDLLSLARLDEGGVGPPFRRWRPAPTCGAGRGGVETGHIPEGTIRIDPDLTAQVVRNLLGNARRHAGPTGGSSSRAGPTEGPWSSRSTTTARAFDPRSASSSSTASTAARPRVGGRREGAAWA